MQALSLLHRAFNHALGMRSSRNNACWHLTPVRATMGATLTSLLDINCLNCERCPSLNTFFRNKEPDLHLLIFIFHGGKGLILRDIAQDPIFVQ